MADAQGHEAQHCSGGAPEWNAYLRQAAEGDSGALAALYDQTSALVYSVARSVLGNAAEAEEITLDVYAYVWRAAATYESRRGTVLTWLTMLARSRALDRLRVLTRANAERHANSVFLEGLPVQLLTCPIAMAEGDQRILVQRALQQLSPEQRNLIELAFFSGLSHRELSLKLNIPLGTIKTRIRMTLVRLRDIIKAPCP